MNKNTVFIGLHHGSLIVQDIATSLNFYCNILGMEINRQRPEMSFDGAWLNVGEQQIHLLKLPQTEQFIQQPEHAGRDRHLAVYVDRIDVIKHNLQQNQISFTMSKSGRQALFCRDPDGNGLEFIQV